MSRRPERLARSYRLSLRRQLAGLAVAALLLPLVTLLLDALGDRLALDGQVLVYLLAVVIVSLVGGILVAIGSAVASALLLNYFFVEPVHTLSVGDPDQLVALIVFVAVAALVSGAIELAVRRARAAERARAEAETMSALAGPKLDGGDSLHRILDRARRTFSMESVTLKVRPPGSGEWIDAGHAGWAPSGTEAPLRFDVPVGPRARMVGRGPALFAEDGRVLEAFAAAARTAYEGQVLSGEAAEARTLATVDRQRTALLAAVGHDLRTPLAGIKASVSSLRQDDVEWSEPERRELLRTIETSADHLDAVIANLLDASRLQAGALTAKPTEVPLYEVVASALMSVPERRRAGRGRGGRGSATGHGRPRPAAAGARERARESPSSTLARAPSKCSPTPAPRARSSRSSTTGAASRRPNGSGCSSPSSASTTTDPRASGSVCPWRAASSRPWAVRWSPTTQPGGGLTMRIRLPTASPPDGRPE